MITIRNAIGGQKFYFFSKDWIYLIYLSFSALPLINYPEHLQYYVRIVIYPFLIMLCFQNINIKLDHLSKRIALIFVVSTVIFAFMFFQYAPGKFDFSLQYILTVDRNAGFFFMSEDRIGPTACAYMLTIPIIILLSNLIFYKSASKYNLLIIILLSPFIIIVGGRNAWVGIFCLLILYLYYMYRKSKKIKFFKIIVITLLIIIVTTSVYFLFEPIFSDQFYNRLKAFTNPIQDQNLLVRFVYWADAIELVSRNYIGYGFNYFFINYGGTPHNEILGQMVGGGLLGTLFFVLYMSIVFRDLFKKFIEQNKNKFVNHFNYMAFSIFIICFIAMLTDNITRSTNTTFYSIFCIFIGIFYYINTTNNIDINRRLNTGNES